VIEDIHLPELSFPRIAIFALAWFVNVIIHETGHFVAARAMGYGLLSAGIAWLVFNREGESLRLRFVARPAHAGFVSGYPRGIDNLRRRHLAVVAAGPIASAAAFAVSAILWRELAALAFWSGMTVVASALPFRSRSAMSDHMQIRTLLRGDAERARFLANLALLSLSIEGTRPRDLPAELVACPDGPGVGVVNRTAHIFRYNWFADAGRLDDAEQALIHNLKQPWAGDLAAVWRYEAVWFAAFHRRNAEVARKWRAGVPPHSSSAGVRCAQLKADAALACVECRTAETASLAREAGMACEKLPDRGITIAVKDALERLLHHSRCRPDGDTIGNVHDNRLET
jgi:hypothetical protein